MRRFMLLLPILFACSKAETPKADTTNAMAAAAAAPMAAALTEADVAGTWSGTSTYEAPDTGSVKWTQICAAGSCKGTIAGQKDTMMSTYTIAGDSSVGTGAPMMDPVLKKKVTDHWVVHLKDGKAVGTGEQRLADKPDSVVHRYRFEGSRAP